MGSACSCQSSVDIKKRLPDASTLRENRKKKNNRKKPHGDLLNVVDETTKSTEAFWVYAASRLPEWLDWQEWAANIDDNAGETQLKELSQQQVDLQTKLVKTDEAQLGRLRASIDAVKALLRVLEHHDEVVNEHTEAASALEHAKKKLAAEEERHENAKKKDDYLERKASFVESEQRSRREVSQREAVFIETKKHVEDSAAKLKTEKSQKAKEFFTQYKQDLIMYHEEALAILKGSATNEDAAEKDASTTSPTTATTTATAGKQVQGNAEEANVQPLDSVADDHSDAGSTTTDDDGDDEDDNDKENGDGDETAKLGNEGSTGYDNNDNTESDAQQSPQYGDHDREDESALVSFPSAPVDDGSSAPPQQQQQADPSQFATESHI